MFAGIICALFVCVRTHRASVPRVGHKTTTALKCRSAIVLIADVYTEPRDFALEASNVTITKRKSNSRLENHRHSYSGVGQMSTKTAIIISAVFTLIL